MHKNLHKKILFTLLILTTIVSSAFSYSITGKVIDGVTKQALPYSNIVIKNTMIGTTSDLNGYFTLDNITIKNTTIIISCIGYNNLEISINSQQSELIIAELEQSAIPLDEIVISSTKNQNSRFEQSTPVSIISQTTISDNNVQNIPEIVVKQPSVSLVGAGYHKSISIRGLARKRVLILIDGHRISSERNPGPPGTFVNPLDIKNIEILRGPYSTLYGSDAVGGVINIITKDYQAPTSNKYVDGVFNSNYQSISNGYNANLLLNTKIADKVFLHLTAGKRKAESYKDAKGEEVMNTNYSEQSASAKITWEIAKNHKLQINGLISLADSIGKPAYLDSINALHPLDNHYKTGFIYEWNNITKWMPQMSIKASAHKHDITARMYNYTATTYGRVVNKEKNLYNNDYIYQHDFSFQISSKIKLLAGFDFYQRDGIHIDEQANSFLYDPDNPNMYLGEQVYIVAIDTTIHDSYQRSAGVFLHANYNVSEKLKLNGGLRFNQFNTLADLTIKKTYVGPPYDYSQNEHDTKTKDNSAVSGNFGVIYNPLKTLIFTANIGQAFRVPSTKELFVNTMTPSGMNISNPDLVPEESLNLDFGIKYKDKNYNSLSLALFHNEINNMINLQWDSLHTSGQFQNIDASIFGGELDFNYHASKQLFFNGNISYVLGRDVNDEVLMDIPPLQINLSAKYFILKNKLFIALSGRYNAEQTEFAIGDIPTDAFYVFDFQSAWNINKYFKATFSVTNILNRYYREHHQFYWERQSGRSFNAGIQLTF